MQRYELVVTTGAGLYRYRIGDCIIVNGFEGKTPVIEFLFRIGKTSSMTGEKLTEHQITEAAQKAVEKVGWMPREMLVFPRTKELPHYGVLMDIGSDRTAHRGKAPIKRWLSTFESSLTLFNTEYADKRRSARLGAPRAMVVDSSEFDACRNIVAAQNIALEQIKLGMLSGKTDLDRNLTIRAEITL